MPDFEAMSVDELVEWRVAKKAEAEAIKDELRASNEVYHRKVEEERFRDTVAAAKLPPGTTVTVGTLSMTVEGH